MSNPVFKTKKSPLRGYKLDSNESFASKHGMPNGVVAAPPEPMTIGDVLNKTLVMFLVVLSGVALSIGGLIVGGLDLVSVMLTVSAGLSIVLGLVLAFKRKPSPVLTTLYSVAMGTFTGSMSLVLEAQFDGIILQAVGATLVVFLTVLVLFRSGKIRATPNLTKFFIVATVAYSAFAILNYFLMLFGATDSMFGLRTEFSPWIGIAIGALAVLLATYSLILDFTFIQEGVSRGVDKKYSWYAAFGLVMTIVWLYIEILRIIAIVRSMAD